MATGADTQPPAPAGPAEPTAERPSFLARWRSKRAFWYAVAAIPYLLIWVVFYFVYLRQISPVDVRLGGTLGQSAAVSSTPELQLAGSVTWQVRSGEIQELQVVRARHALVALPVAPDECEEVRGANCSGGSVKSTSPVTLTWKRAAQPFDASQQDGERMSFRLGEEGGQLALGAESEAQGDLHACLAPLGSDTLTLAAAAASAAWNVSGDDAPACPGGGLRIEVEDDMTAGAADAFVIRNVRTVDFRGSANSFVLSGRKSGTVHFGSDSQDFGDEEVQLEGDEALRPRVALEQDRKRASVVIPTFQASSAQIAGEELLPTNLERNRWWVVSAFFGLAGLISTLLKLGDWIKEKSEANK